MFDALDRQINEMVVRGHDPAAIIMSPREMTRFKHEVDKTRIAFFPDPHERSSGWKYRDLPIYRSWEISGPCVVSADVLRMLLKAGHHRRSLDLSEALVGTAAVQDHLDPILF